MKPSEIRAELVRLEISQVSIARRLKITRGTVNSIVSRKRKSMRIQKVIARILKRPYAEIWNEGDAA